MTRDPQNSTLHTLPAKSEKEPIAIIGIGCRFPGGANDPDSFWRLLCDGVDAITDIPDDRWNVDLFYDSEAGTPGKTNACRGGFVRGIDQFDANFFGISPREAARMDPQQRLLLEVAWEALEDAGQVPERLGETHTGVFIGISSQDYVFIQHGSGDLTKMDAHTNTGGAMSVAANRISYCLNLRGPSIALDTGCSSSLVAVHLACQSLWHDGCPFALAGGVNVLIRPEPYVGFSRLSMLAPDGRCKAFDAGANGYVRSEGAGIVVLKPLSQALRDRDQIYALIEGSAVNQDGRTTGLTVPSQRAQEELVKEACQRAGISPNQVQFVEAHGTGTWVGDPIEARALGAALAKGRPDGIYCIIGSVKTNIGHLEAAAGIAGLIKVALALKHRMIPANLHFNHPNPEIPFDELKLRVPQTLEPWPEQNVPALAGVNSFGFGGTNAHIILQEPPRLSDTELKAANEASAGLASHRTVLIPFSARSPEALRAVARSYHDFLLGDSGSHVSLEDVCWTTSLRRSHHDHRLAIVANSKQEILKSLEAFSSGKIRAGMASGRPVAGRDPRIVFVFSGQGGQWWAMGRELLETEPVFRQMIERCDDLMRLYVSWSLLNELTADESCSRLEETAFAQPAIFAIQVGLAKLWQSWGIKPDAVVGHSVGEVAAAYVSGALSLKAAVRVVFHRGRCMELASAHGRMLAVGLPLAEIDRLLEGKEDRISIAAINSPTSISLSGDSEALEEIAQALERQEVFCRFLQVNYAFHSSLMDPIRSELLHSLEGLDSSTASLPIYSTVTGLPADGSELNAEYWWQNVRKPVRFAAAVEGLLQGGFNVFLELAPHPVLSSSVMETAHHRRAKATVLHSLRRGEEERATMLKSLGVLYTLGSPVNWDKLSPKDGQFVRLPSYPWQRERYWSETEESKQYRIGPRTHPLLGRRLVSAIPTWEYKVDRRVHRYLNDHRVQDRVLLPATFYVEIVLAAARELYGSGPFVIEEVEFSKACFLEETEATTIHVVVNPSESTFSVYSRLDEPSRPWSKHVDGRVRVDQKRGGTEPANLDEVRSRCTVEVAGSECYKRMQQAGLDYGPTFQGLERLWSGQGEALGLILAPEELQGTLNGYHLHPALLDACFQVITGALRVQGRYASGRLGLYLPVELTRATIFGRSAARLWSHVRVIEQSGNSLVADVRVLDDVGNLVLEAQGFRCQSIDSGRHASPARDLNELVYECQWQFKPRPGLAVRRQVARKLPSPSRIRETTIVEAEQLTVGFVGWADRHDLFEDSTRALCTAFLLNAFQKLGLDLQLEEEMTIDALADRLRVTSRYRRVLHRYLEMLEADGILRKGDSGWKVCRVPDIEDPKQTWQKLLTRNPAYFAELTLIGRCGVELAAVLRGDVDPLHLIFPDGSLAIAEHLYQDSPSLLFNNILTRRAIAAMFDEFPEDETVRLLEIGAGTGGLTAYVLPRLPADRTEYVFTDISNHFFLRAEEKFRDYPFIKCQRLDIEADPCAQGFDPHSFDIVVASHVLHATADLRQTLKNLSRLMASEGMLLLQEPVKPLRWVELVFGLTEGWWRFTDKGLRPFSHPLLSLGRWRSLLEEVGFTDVCELSGRREDAVNNAMILARGARFEQDNLLTAPVEVAGSESPGEGSWVIFADRGGSGHKLASELQSRGERCIMVFPGDAYQRLDHEQFEVSARRSEDFRQLLQDVMGADRPACRGVVHLWNFDALAAEETTIESFNEAMVSGCLSVVYLAQALSEVEAAGTPRLWLVTSGAQSVGKEAEATSPIQAGVWGLGPVIASEVPNLRTTMVDISAAATEGEIRSLCEELRLNDEEDQVALRGDARYVQRFMRAVAHRVSWKASDFTSMDTEAYRLETSRVGTLDTLTLRAVERRKPRPGEVEIRVTVAGLNFSDVMKALGIYPGLPDGPVPLGIECAGKISAVGPGVVEHKVGDEVIVLAPFSFGPYVTTAARFVVAKPPHYSFEEAATLSVAFLTAHYALNYLGRLRKGERVLIHSATGGVGLAAIQLAKRAGAEIFATAGTEEKREFLRSIGIQHVMDSRSLAFADEVMERTGGQGVDVVLNSLAGEAIREGLRILRDHGRFLEIGKRDIYQNSRLGLRPFKKNLSFMAIDLDRALRERPALVSSLFQEMMEGFRDGTLAPLPCRVFPISNSASAFRYMAQARHIGKVLLSLQELDVSIAPSSEGEMTFRDDGTYLITGGLGGFGLTAAEWMVERGARHLVLMGRRGAHSPEAQGAVDTMRRMGAEVVVARADVTSREQVARVCEEIERSMPPLRGVVHAAMVGTDWLLLNLNEERMREVWAPKVIGAWNLHTQTLNNRLDFFVLFSSVASVWGLEGQGSYASANAFLDSLAYHRRAHGLPATSVSWGYLGEVGWVARHGDIAKRLEARGLESFAPNEALTLLGGFLRKAPPHLLVLRIDWRRLREAAGTMSMSPRISHILRQGDQGEAGLQKRGGAAIRNALLAAKPSERIEIMTSLLREQVARVLGAAPEKLDVEKPLTEMGLDSLMGVELRNWIEGELRLSVPILELLRGPSVARLAELLVSPLCQSGDGPPAPNVTREDASEKALIPTDQLSDGNIESFPSKMVSETARELQNGGESH